MEKFATEILILLQFVIEDLKLESSEGIDNEILRGDTVLNLHILDNAPILVTEQDISSKKGGSCIDSQGNGKSCLLSFSPLRFEEALVEFNIHVDISKKLQQGEIVQIGKSVVPIVQLFKELIEKYKKEQSSVKLLEKDVRIIGLSGACIGFMTIFIELSVYGKYLITQLVTIMEDLINGDCDYKPKPINGLAGIIPPRVIQCNYVFCPPSPLCSTSVKPETSTPTPPPSTNIPSTQFREVGASMGNNAVTIRVRKEPQSDVYCTENKDCEYKNECNCESLPPPDYQPACICTKESDDPNKDKILLKIGKKKDGSCQKESDLEVEICCPKGKPIKPKPTTQDRDSQFAGSDFPEGYLETYYGKEIWAKMRAEQLAVDEKLIKIFGKKLMNQEDYPGVNSKGKKGEAPNGKEKKAKGAKIQKK